MNGGKCTKVGVSTKGPIWPTGLVCKVRKSQRQRIQFLDFSLYEKALCYMLLRTDHIIRVLPDKFSF